MKTLTALIGVFALFTLASTLESYDAQTRYFTCVKNGSHGVYTDLDAMELEQTCTNLTGHKE